MDDMCRVILSAQEGAAITNSYFSFWLVLIRSNADIEAGITVIAFFDRGMCCYNCGKFDCGGRGSLLGCVAEIIYELQSTGFQSDIIRGV